jgi:hypothetical protein
MTTKKQHSTEDAAGLLDWLSKTRLFNKRSKQVLALLVVAGVVGVPVVMLFKPSEKNQSATTKGNKSPALNQTATASDHARAIQTGIGGTVNVQESPTSQQASGVSAQVMMSSNVTISSRPITIMTPNNSGNIANIIGSTGVSVTQSITNPLPPPFIFDTTLLSTNVPDNQPDGRLLYKTEFRVVIGNPADHMRISVDKKPASLVNFKMFLSGVSIDSAMFTSGHGKTFPSADYLVTILTSNQVQKSDFGAFEVRQLSPGEHRH